MLIEKEENFGMGQLFAFVISCDYFTDKCITFLIIVTKFQARCKLKEERFSLAHSLKRGNQSWRREMAAGQLVDRKSVV